MRVILVRHGDAVGTKGKFHGLVDNPLTHSGRLEAAKTAEALKKYKPTRLYSSQMSRARETANIIGSKLGLQTQVDKNFNPLDLGDFVGKPVDTNLDKVRQYLSNPDRRIPGGGSVAEWANNYNPAINRLLYDPSDETAVVVTHGRNIILTKADMKTGNNPSFDKSELLNAGTSTEHGGYAIADGNKGTFEIITPHQVKSGQS